MRTLILLTLLLLATACQQQVASTAAQPMPTVPTLLSATDAPPTNVPTLRPPIVQTIAPKVTEPSAFALPSAEELVTATPIPTDTPTPLPTGTPTPPPTFTPPSLPGTSPNDHYWFYRPVPDGGTVWTDKSYPYGSTRGGTLRPHHGVEFQVPSGTGVYAAATGTVVVAGDDVATAFGERSNFYGNLVIIEHETTYKGQPVFTLYAHLSQVGVAVGQKVQARDLIALSGSSGIADGPHLHFEVRIGANRYSATRNPTLWLYPFDEHGTVVGRVTFPNGVAAEGAQVTATRIDAKSVYKGTTTYMGRGVNGDNGWNENFVIDDVKVGFYLITVTDGVKRYKQEVWVHEYQTTFVEIEIPSP
ncbi:MAG: peptidoglycan DD-metalloendopeptidase family protein [Candidatus Promineifilaceae bacterium]